MLKIRLARVGAKKKPSYRVVVIDKRSARNSRSVEIVGHYNPTKDPIALSLDEERIQHWLGKGAKPSDTVRRLLAYKGERSSDGPETPADAVKEESAAAQHEAPAPKDEPAAQSAASETAPADQGDAKASPEESQPTAEENRPAAEDASSS